MKKFNSKIWLTVLGLAIAAVLLVFGINYFSNNPLSFASVTEESQVLSVEPRNINLLPEETILVDSMVNDYVEIGVSNRSEEPMLTQISANDYEVNEDSPVLDMEIMPWFYGSPNVEPVSQFSRARQATLVRDESINGFSWREVSGEILLYQYDEPYTGFHTTLFDGWHYFVDGVIQEYYVPNIEIEEMLLNRKIINDLVPVIRPNLVFLEPLGNYSQLLDVQPVSYPILYKNTENLILTSPPGTRGSRLLTTTEEFEDIPMDVVEEVTTFDGEWIHVYIGYDELGWIRKDDTGTDYVPTYYSERELLDTIEAVLAEELSYVDARIGASFVNNETMSQISVNNQVFFPASTQKIYVLGELYHQYSTGELDPYESTMTLYNSDKVGGAGIIAGYPEGSVFTLDELVNLVVIYSDNTAANLLIDAVGGSERINPHVHQLGLYDTYVTGKYYHDAFFTTTPEDAARYFALLYNNQLNGEPYDEMLIEKFYMNSHTFLRSYLWNADGWNKSGLGGTEQNDVATFVTPYGSYSIAIYTAEPWNYDAIGNQVGSISARVYDVFNEIRSDLWITVEEAEEVDDTESEFSSTDETYIEESITYDEW